MNKTEALSLAVCATKSLAATLLVITNSCTNSQIEAINMLKWLPQCLYSVSVKEVIKQQFTSCMKVGTGGTLDLSREYHTKQFGPRCYSLLNGPLRFDYNSVM